jgi:hypothetical protein
MTSRDRSRLDRAWWIVAVVGLIAFGAGVALLIGGGSVPLGIVLVLAGPVLVLFAVTLRTGWEIPL